MYKPKGNPMSIIDINDIYKENGGEEELTFLLYGKDRSSISFKELLKTEKCVARIEELDNVQFIDIARWNKKVNNWQRFAFSNPLDSESKIWAHNIIDFLNKHWQSSTASINPKNEKTLIKNVIKLRKTKLK